MILAFKTLEGKIFKKVSTIDHELIKFETNDDKIYILRHDQQCCENVNIEDITGDLNDLVGSPIIMAEESFPELPGKQDASYADVALTYTWTFYKIATIKGSVTIRFYGESNGFHSETAQLYEEI